MLELAGCALVDGAVLGGDDAGGDGLRKRKWAADGLDPVADLGGVGVAQFNGRKRRAGVDLDDGKVGGLVDADDAGGTAKILSVGIGGELDVDFVGFVDDVVVGDDVALGIDDEAGAERFLHLAIVGAVIGAAGRLAAKEAVEEVLKVVLSLSLLTVVLIVVIARILLVGLRAELMEVRAVFRLLGQSLRY